MNVASTFRRMVAHSFDELLGSLFWIPLAVSAWRQMASSDHIVLSWSLFLSVWVLRLFYEIICTYALEALPAQHFLGLRIISTNHPELGLSLSQVVLRVLFAQFKYLLGPSIYFMALFHRQRQHLGDILSETRVVQVNERSLKPKNRYLIGSLLVFMSLITNLSKVVNFVAEENLSRRGIRIEAPRWEIQLDSSSF